MKGDEGLLRISVLYLLSSLMCDSAKSCAGRESAERLSEIVLLIFEPFDLTVVRLRR